MTNPGWAIEGETPTTARGQRTRSKLIDAADELFRRQRFDDVTTVSIASESGVSVGTFYAYFANKEEIFVEILSRALVHMSRHATDGWQQGATLDENLRSTTKNYLLAYHRNSNILRNASELEAHYAPVRGVLWGWRREMESRMLRRLIHDQGISTAEPLEPIRLLRALVSMVENYARRAFADGEFGPLMESDVETAAEVPAAIWYRAIFGSGGEADVSRATSR
jgi:AcrR family transcriptional regulator